MLLNLLLLGVGLILLPLVAFRALSYQKRERFRNEIVRRTNNKKPIIIGIFHPYCNDGGGGERVLWVGVRVIQEREPRAHCIIYSGDEAQPEEIVQRAKTRFGIEFPRSVEFIKLRKRNWVESSRYPKFTVFGQSLGSMVLGLEAWWKQPPDIFLDTMGYSFTYPIFKLASCKVGCYTHYPTISTDMLTKIAERRLDYNNNQVITSSTVLSSGKLLYYQVFAKIYGFMGRKADVVMVNSTWTKNNINCVWNVPERTSVVFPPCNTSDLSSEIPLDTPREPIIISVAQFRDEKNHLLQLLALQHLFQTNPKERTKGVKLILIGSCRNELDQHRIDELKRSAKELGIAENVEFQVNVSYPELKKWLSKALIGLHTMWCEHFGIGIVELMAAGVVAIAHNSGGPKSDIVKEGSGYLAITKEEYASCISKVLEAKESELVEIRRMARDSTGRFSEEAFELHFYRAFSILLASF